MPNGEATHTNFIVFSLGLGFETTKALEPNTITITPSIRLLISLQQEKWNKNMKMVTIQHRDISWQNWDWPHPPPHFESHDISNYLPDFSSYIMLVHSKSLWHKTILVSILSTTCFNNSHSSFSFDNGGISFKNLQNKLNVTFSIIVNAILQIIASL